MAKEKVDELIGRKRRVNVLAGDDHVWSGFEEERDDPRGISAAKEEQVSR